MLNKKITINLIESFFFENNDLLIFNIILIPKPGLGLTSIKKVYFLITISLAI